ncbi:MAG TPA: MHYT domain-containing protein [Streptosporangiaceae bacterium]|nr:MHYT domain-containing protein [Streptosporangiaceae bacterium]
MLTAHNFSYGLLTPALAYLMSCLGAFLGLRCTARAMACTGRERLGWLLLGAVSIGTTGIWVMHFIAMLGYTVPGQVIHYNVLVTIGSMLIAVIVVGIGLLIVGFARRKWTSLLLAGTFTGVGVAAMHYTGMAAMRLPARMTYSPALFGLSVVIAVVAATAALWAALNLSGARANLAASLIMGVAVSGMHYTGMAAMHLFPPGAGGGMEMAGGGATAETFLLPLLIGISILAFIMTATLALSPTDEEIRADAALLQRIEAAQGGMNGQTGGAGPLPSAVQSATVISRATQARRQAEREEPYSRH